MYSLPPPSNELHPGYPLGSCHPSSLICPVLVHPPEFTTWILSIIGPILTHLDICLQSGGHLMALNFFDSW